MAKEYLRILHLNDLHSHFESFPKVKRFFEEFSETDAEVIRMDIGDNIDKSHPMTELTSGKINCQLMNELGIQYATIGNNEGIGLAKSELNQVYEDADFSLVLCNMFDENGQPSWAKPYIIHETRQGTKLAILGVTFPYTLAYEPNGWIISDPIKALEEVLKEEEVKHADCRILMSHLGITVDEKITTMLPEIDLIIGSHTHHVFEEGEVLNGTYLAAAGKYGQFVGEINLVFDKHHLISANVLAHETRYLPSSKDDQQWVDTFSKKGRLEMAKEKVVTFERDLSLEESSQLVMKAMLAYSKADCVLLNTGLVVEPFSKEVTHDTLHHALPHQMRLIQLELKKYELAKVIDDILIEANFLKHQEIRGMGFRGKTFGEMVYLGFSLKNGEIFFDDRLIDNDMISLVLVDQYYFAPYFDSMQDKEVSLLFPELLRDVVRNYLRGEL